MPWMASLWCESGYYLAFYSVCVLNIDKMSVPSFDVSLRVKMKRFPLMRSLLVLKERWQCWVNFNPRRQSQPNINFPRSLERIWSINFVRCVKTLMRLTSIWKMNCTLLAWKRLDKPKEDDIVAFTMQFHSDTVNTFQRSTSQINESSCVFFFNSPRCYNIIIANS